MDRIIHRRSDPGDEQPEEQPKRRYCVFCRRLFDSQSEYLGHACPKYGAAVAKESEKRKYEIVTESWASPLRFIYVHNPFYVISACLVLYGLNGMFGTSSEAASAWGLMGVLAAYSCLLAFAGVLIVKIGKVWEDARSILLIIVVLFLSLSVSFDEILISRPESGRALLLAGLVFAAVLSEVLLRGLKIRLPALFRLPYYAILSFFFLYPLYLVRPVYVPIRSATLWELFLFPAWAALLFLSLLPAIRRGISYVRENGTPWKWPAFPWVLFAVLSLAVCVRSYYLTLSFDSLKGMDSIFGFYFLIPFVLSAAVLLLEIGIMSGMRSFSNAALSLPILAMILSFPGSACDAYNGFVEEIFGTIGSPVLWTAMATALFYAYAILRNTENTEVGFALSLLFFSVAGLRTRDIHSLVGPRVLPIVYIALFEVYLAFRKRTSWRAFLATTGAMVTLSIGLSDTWFVSWQGAIPVHIGYVCLLAWAALFEDRLARGMQHLGAYILLALCFFAGFLSDTFLPSVSEGISLLYVMVMAGLAFGYWRVVDNRLYLKAALYGTGIAILTPSRPAVRAAERVRIPEGIGPLLWGGVAFVVAFAISLVKGRIPQKLAWAPGWLKPNNSSEEGGSDALPENAE